MQFDKLFICFVAWFNISYNKLHYQVRNKKLWLVSRRNVQARSEYTGYATCYVYFLVHRLAGSCIYQENTRNRRDIECYAIPKLLQDRVAGKINGT